MDILITDNFFLKDIKEIYSTEIRGKYGVFENFLEKLKIKILNGHFRENTSQIDWKNIVNHHQISFYNQENQLEISNWLLNSDLKDYGFLYTWISWEDPIIMIKTSEFIKNWRNVYLASTDGLILTTYDGKFFIEFTHGDVKILNSNFQIKPNSYKTNNSRNGLKNDKLLKNNYENFFKKNCL
jgi:hypothetical protein